MRQTKFRAYGSRPKKRGSGRLKPKMYQWEEIQFITPEGLVVLKSEGLDFDRCSTADDFILIEWTGLKDKNGKEIYEGDIVQDNVSKAEVIFQDACFYALPKGGGCNVMSLPEYCEVIGNIWEHRELLND